MGARAIMSENAGPGPAMRRRLAGFVLTLRDAGFVIGQAEAQDAARLMTSALADRPGSLRAAMRALFASRRADFSRFEELFDAFWRARPGASNAGRAPASRRATPPILPTRPLPRARRLKVAGGPAAPPRMKQYPARTSPRSRGRGNAPARPSLLSGWRA
jgi:uncharacterized protein with von Willebrand factor type A (vWA) domain